VRTNCTAHTYILVKSSSGLFSEVAGHLFLLSRDVCNVSVIFIWDALVLCLRVFSKISIFLQNLSLSLSTSSSSSSS